MINNRCKYQFT